MRKAPLLLLAALLATPFGPGHASDGQSAHMCLRHEATILGTKNRDEIQGTIKRDVIVSRSGDDEISAVDGNDYVCAGSGDDVIRAGYGTDRVRGGSGDDRLEGGPGNDWLIGEQGRDVVEAGDGRSDTNTLIGASGRDRLIGGDGRSSVDYLFGGSDGDYLDGGDGGHDEDFFFGGDGRDYFFGGCCGDDTALFIFESDGVTIDLTELNPVDSERVEAIESLIGSPFDDVLIGDEERNLLRGMAGNDRVHGGEGYDVVDGGSGNDDLIGDLASFFDSPEAVDVRLDEGVASGAGSDTMSGFSSLEGSIYADLLRGDDKGNDLSGGVLRRDTLTGLGGDDYLEFGGEGSDAGEGNDTCFSSNASNCEYSNHYDFRSFWVVTSPGQASITPASEFDEIELELAPAMGRPKPQIALLRLTPNGCSWWMQAKSELMPGPCGAPTWNRRVTPRGTLPGGWYIAMTNRGTIEAPPTFQMASETQVWFQLR